MAAHDDGPIAYRPSEGLSYDPSEPLYWDAGALRREIERTFEICHGCRLCFKFCDAFPTLFSLLDERHDGDVRKIDADETRGIVDQCYQCKLCEVQCPYTRRDQHEFQLDFPALMHRARAQRAPGERRLRDRVLADPDRAGKAARASLGLANLGNRLAPVRWLLQEFLGIHRKKLLPPFARSTFERWARTTGRIAQAPAGVEAVLFQTCYVQNNEPEIGRDTVSVLERSQVGVRCVEGLRCCGMPAWERGDLEALRRQARQNLDILMPFVDAGAKILAINPTCSMMMRREHPALLDPGDRPAAERLAAAVMDPSEFLWSIRSEPRFCSDFKSTPNGPVAYHAPCHLRTQAVGFKGRDLLRKIPGVKPATVLECCGHDGTYAMTVEGFEPSARLGKRAFEGMQEAGASCWATDCPLAAVQFAQHAGVKPMHPMSILARAYREDGFSTPVEGVEKE